MTSLRYLLALNMKARRQILHLSQAKLAEKLDSAPSYIAMVETQKQFPSVEMLERIAEALEIDAPELFSTQSYPADSLKQLHKDFLSDIQDILASKLKKLEEKG
jgi:transcriptional regulator with XRE-family HTH domain